VETTVQDEDTMPITQGVVAAIKAKNFDLVEKKPPTHPYSQEYLVGMMKHPNLVPSVRARARARGGVRVRAPEPGAQR
jgi:hypothetical protein